MYHSHAITRASNRATRRRIAKSDAASTAAESHIKERVRRDRAARKIKSTSTERRFKIRLDEKQTWDYRRRKAIGDGTLELALARKLWGSNQPWSLKQAMQRTRSSLMMPNEHDEHDNDDDDDAEVEREAIRDELRGDGISGHFRTPPTELSELMPGHTFGEDQVFGSTFVKDETSGFSLRRKARASIIAQTNVEVLVLRKRDLFQATTFEMREAMRMRAAKRNEVSHSEQLAHPEAFVREKRIWEAYKAYITREIMEKHAARAHH